MSFAQIALAVPLRRYFDYHIPKTLQPVIQVGCRVEVPFGRQKSVGIVVGLITETNLDEAKIKSITRLIDEKPLFDASLVAMKKWLCQYYVCPAGEVFINLLPKKLKSGAAAELKQEDHWRLSDETIIPNKRALKQTALIELLTNKPSQTSSQLKQAGFSTTLLKKLADNQQIERFQPALAIDNSDVALIETPLALTQEQHIALDKINEHSHHFQPFLLDGVTGSGKTEIYLQAIAKVLSQGKQALVLVPEIGLTPQTLNRFAKRFDTEILALHSELNDTERHNAWLKAKFGLARIIIGTRSAVLVPMPNLGLIILDEEHDLSYKQQDGLRYNARDVAVKRAHLQKIPIILGSATPALETVKNANEEKYIHLKLTQRVQQTPPPTPHIIDIKHQPMQAGLAYGVIKSIENHLNNGNQVLIFLNRRGFSPALICHECGWVCQCQRCDNHYTYHKSIRQLQCHHCGDIVAIPQQCHECGSSQIVDWGVGTEQLEDFLAERFPDAKPLRIDRDTVRKKGQLAQKLESISAGEHQLLIGTQMLAKGHHFPNLTLTVVMNLDNALYSSDFRALERMSQLLIQVAGRAGRGDKKGQVVLQSHCPEHEVLQLLIKKGYQSVQNYLLSERKAMALPPYQFWALLRIEALQLTTVQDFCQHLGQAFSDYIQPHYPKVQAMPAMPAPQEKRAGRYRYLIVFESIQRSHLNAAMHQLTHLIEAQKGYSAVRWTLDIDPQELN